MYRLFVLQIANSNRNCQYEFSQHYLNFARLITIVNNKHYSTRLDSTRFELRILIEIANDLICTAPYRTHRAASPPTESN